MIKHKQQTFLRNLLADRHDCQNTARLLEFVFTIMLALQVINCFSSQFHGSGLVVTLANTDGGYKRADNTSKRQKKVVYTHIMQSVPGPARSKMAPPPAAVCVRAYS